MMKSHSIAAAKNPTADSRDMLLVRLAHDQEIATTLRSFPSVQRNSVLEQDDQTLHGYALSALVLDLLATATHVSSSLQALIVIDTKDGADVSAPLHGPYAFVRAHLEATSQALWLMAPQSRRARIKRSIQHWCGEVRLLNGFQDEWSKSFPVRKNIGHEDLRTIAAEAGLSVEGFPAKRTWAPVGSGAILQSLEFAHEDATLTWFNSWQLCSGFAHSKQWASRIFNEQHTATDEVATDSPVIGKTSLPMLASVVNEAGQLLDEAARRYGQLSSTPYAAWPR